jgi:predicted SprT family Zn-dependent metalloprotease
VKTFEQIFRLESKSAGLKNLEMVWEDNPLEQNWIAWATTEGKIHFTKRCLNQSDFVKVQIIRHEIAHIIDLMTVMTRDTVPTGGEYVGA